MINSPSNNGQTTPADVVNQPSRRTRLLRAAADAQLSPVGLKALRDHLAVHPEDQSVIAFEQHVRRSIAATASAQPSSELREKIQRMRTSARQEPKTTPFIAGVEGTSTPSTRKHPRPRNWLRSRPLRWLAIAASLAIVAYGGAIAYFTIQLSQSPATLLPTQDEPGSATHRIALVSFVSSHHDECELHADMVGHKLRIDSLDKAPAAFREVLGRAPDLGRLAASGLEFKGAGPCAVPGRGASVHMVFDAGAGFVGGTEDADGRTPLRTPMVSIFIQQDTGELNIEPGRTYRLTLRRGTDSSSAASGAGNAEIFVWKADGGDGFIYFLSSTFEPAMEKARLALGANEPSGTLQQ